MTRRKMAKASHGELKIDNLNEEDAGKSQKRETVENRKKTESRNLHR